ncbi:hypothetical protein [Paucisalibacillus globulus]|uniref:hypothetical protein n=1 Tax=Paucisalibacillus globulus TaxID=351095 RepID=UPI001C3EE928|nr:hypothetical protein [Paucisalibacillus globulus]
MYEGLSFFFSTFDGGQMKYEELPFFFSTFVRGPIDVQETSILLFNLCLRTN